MPGLFDPSSFMPGAAGAGGLFDRLRGIVAPPGYQPGGALPGQPGSDAMASAAPAPAAAPGAPPSQPPGFLDRAAGSLGGLYNASPLLMEMGGAMMQGGLGAGLRAGGAAAQQLQQRNIQMMGWRATYAALKQRGYSDADATAIMMNPEASKAAFGNIYGPDTASVVDVKNPNSPFPSSGVLRSKSGELTPAVPIPAAAMQKLLVNRDNPQAAIDFDAAFGPGSARRALGGP
jgi:hypothetical protein